MTDRRYYAVVLLLLIGIQMFMWRPAEVEATAGGFRGKVIMVVADKLSLGDWSQLPDSTFRRLSQKGAIGLMNTTTGGGRDSANAYATIGAGARVVATRGGGLAYNTWEVVEDIEARYLYQSRVGQTPESQNIIHPFLPQIIEQNNSLQYSSVLGSLGSELHKAGRKTYLWGNSDYEDNRQRFGALIAMDEKGLIDGGLVDDQMVKADPVSLYGVATNEAAILTDLDSKWQDVDFGVIDLGDTIRVDNGSNIALPEVAGKHRLKVVKAADQLLEQIVQRLDPSRDLLIVVSPSPGSVALENKYWYGPVLFYGAGVNPGVLTSGTTKRIGIIANIDLAPTVLEFFDLPVPANMYGDLVTVEKKAGAIDWLKKVELQGNTVLSSRTILVQGFIILVIICLFFGLTSVFLAKPRANYIKPTFLWLMCAPIAFLIAGLTYPNTIAGLALEILLLSLGLAVIAKLISRHSLMWSLVFITAVTTITVLADILMGSPMMKESVLGYDAMVGARFYGIGNEYMGVLIGAAIIGASILVELSKHRRRQFLAGLMLFYLFVTYVMAAPNLGTNVGGTIAAVVGFTVTILLLARVKINWRVALGIGAGVIAVILLFIMFDLSRATESQSHIGRTARLIIDNGLTEVYNIITRKLAVNLRLILGITVWARVFIGSLVAIAILSVRPVGVMKQIKAKYTYFYAGLISTIVASLTALTFNDSGIVAAALLMIFPVSTLILLVLSQTNDEKIMAQ